MYVQVQTETGSGRGAYPSFPPYHVSEEYVLTKTRAQEMKMGGFSF